MKRKVYDQLLKWKENSNGKTAVLFKGQDELAKVILLKNLLKTIINLIY